MKFKAVCAATSGNERGATVVMVAVLMVVLLGFAAFAIDIGHIVLAKNQLQNAADAGALAGALELYNPDGSINVNANQLAFDAATANAADATAVEVRWNGDNSTSEVQRGHWSFGLTPNLPRGFTPNASLVPVDLEGLSAADLDANPNFINAVRVVARRQATPVFATFAQLFGHTGFTVHSQAVAYIGFADSFGPNELDQPIAICQRSIVDETGRYNCNTGRMINSGADPGTSNTGGWTSFYQGDGACSGTSASEMNGLVCSDGNPDSLTGGLPMSTTGGELQSVFNQFRSCWQGNSHGGTEPWTMTLPVVDCTGNNVGNCPTLVGAVTVNLLWMTAAGTPDPETDTPTSMASPSEDGEGWDYGQTSPDQCGDFRGQVGNALATALTALPAGFQDAQRWQGQSTYTDGMARWDCFVSHFQLKNADDQYATLAKKSMYFQPDCDPQPPRGSAGIYNFGILSDRPALVE